jgi:hypothetical protein
VEEAPIRRNSFRLCDWEIHSFIQTWLYKLTAHSYQNIRFAATQSKQCTGFILDFHGQWELPCSENCTNHSLL